MLVNVGATSSRRRRAESRRQGTTKRTGMQEGDDPFQALVARCAATRDFAFRATEELPRLSEKQMRRFAAVAREHGAAAVALQAAGVASTKHAKSVAELVAKCGDTLETLDLTGNDLKPSGVRTILRAVADSPKCRNVFLTANKRAGDGAAASVAQAMREGKLHIVSLWNVGLTDAGVAPLAAALAADSSRLVDLNLTRNVDITDEGVMSIVRALPASRLEYLALSVLPNVTRASLVPLAHALPASRLKFLALRRSSLEQMDAETIEAFAVQVERCPRDVEVIISPPESAISRMRNANARGKVWRAMVALWGSSSTPLARADGDHHIASRVARMLVV